METVLPLIENVALLALAALLYTATPRIEDGWSPMQRFLAIGLGLGGVSAIVMLIPVTLIPGLIFDARAAPILLSGILGGPVTAVVAVIPPVFMRIWIGGIGMEAGVAGLVVSALSSIVAWYALQRWNVKRTFPVLLIYAAGATIVGLPSIFLLPDTDLAWSLLPSVGTVLVLTNVGGVAILGLMVSLERHRRDMLASLSRSEAAAREALSVRNRFIAMMSHEVRTPLNAILGYAQLLRDDALTEKQADRVRRLSGSAKDLLRLIDSIIQFSQSQDAPPPVELAPCILPAVVGGALDELRVEAEAKGLDVRSSSEGVPALAIETDGPMLRQILVNILSNAVKFTQQGHVVVRTAVEGSGSDARLTIAVSDTGPGIPQDSIERVFEPFERLGTAPVPGVGLGMAVVRASVAALGGTISIDSSQSGGTVVTVEVPVVVHGPLPGDGPSTVPRRPSKNETYVPARDSARVLVVDDVPTNAEIAGAFLKLVGCTVVTAADGAEAVQIVRNGGIDVVLMDIEMPVMNGLEATRVLRRATTPEPARSVPIIALTAYASRADMHACLDAGMTGYLSKPVERDALYAALARCGILRAEGGDAADAGEAVDVAEFDAERYQTLQKLVPDAALQQILKEAAVQIEALGAQVQTESVEPADKRQALHKLISISGNIGLLRLSTLSRRFQDRIVSGGTLSEAEVQTFIATVEQALAKIDDLRAPSSRPE